MAILKYPEKLRMYNDVLIKAQSETEEFIEGKGIKLHKNIVTEVSDDAFYYKQKGKKISGEVVAIPYAIRPTRNHQVDYMFPRATQWFGGETIQLQIHAYQNVIRRKLQERETKQFTDKYRSGHYEPQFTRNDEQPILSRVGDTAWFHYLSLCDETYMGQDDAHNRYYRVPYESIFCFTNGSDVRMVNGYMQVEPYWDSDFEEIEVDGKVVRGKLKGNLVVGLKEAPEYLTGRVVRKGACFGADDRRTVQEGDIVLYAKGSEFKNTIQGKEVMLMQQWQVIARKVDNTFIPVGDYCTIRTHRIPPRKIVLMDSYKREMGGVIEDVASMKKDLQNLIIPVGEVLAAGEKCEHVSASSGKVFFNTKARAFNLEDTIFIREGDIMAEWEGEYHIPTELRISI